MAMEQNLVKSMKLKYKVRIHYNYKWDEWKGIVSRSHALMIRNKYTVVVCAFFYPFVFSGGT